jgi:uncharacterized alkaline shock family protein YloU
MTAAAQRGTTTIADKAVRKIAEQAAGEVLPAPATRSTRGSATVRGRRTAVTLRTALPYPAPLSEAARHVQQHVSNRTRRLTGLETARVELAVTTLTVVSANPPAAQAPGAGPPPAAQRAPGRWWSARRTPMAVLTLAASAAWAAVTADVVRVHATTHTAAAWRMRLLEWLSRHGPGSTPIVAAGALVALAGLTMIVLALTPGRRRQLPLALTTAVGNAAVDRSTVAALIRDAVADVDGISTVAVRVRRRRIRARARLAFGDLTTAHDQADSAARQALADCQLRHTPRLRVSVVPEPVWQPPGSAENSLPQQPGAGIPARDVPAERPEGEVR